MIKLSLIIPVYNEEKCLADCLDSIAAQTVMPDEVIVVDNGSTDGSAEIARDYPFVKLIKQSKRGTVYARNLGFDTAKSILIGRIDADTILAKDWVESVKDSYVDVGQPKLYAATSASHFRNRLAVFWYVMHRLTYFWPSRWLLGHSTLVGSNMILTKQLWQRVRYDVCQRTDLHEDMDLAYHACKVGAQIEFFKYYKASVLARKMMSRVFSYPLMMLKIKFLNN